MQNNVRRFTETLCSDDLTVIQPALAAVMQDEDILIIVIREAIAANRLIVGSKTATAIGGVIVESEPRRSLLAKFAKRLNDSISSNEYLEWMDGVLARNLHLEADEFAREWSKLEDVREIRKAFAKFAG